MAFAKLVFLYYCKLGRSETKESKYYENWGYREVSFWESVVINKFSAKTGAWRGAEKVLSTCKPNWMHLHQLQTISAYSQFGHRVDAKALYEETRL